MKRKCASSDFTNKMLPSNRKKQFLDLFKTRHSIIFKILLTSLLFSIPLLISYSIKYFYILPSAYEQLKDTPDKYIAFFKLTNIIFYSIDVFNYTVLFIGFAGIIYIMKKIVWSEPVYYIKDLFLGIKHNWSIFLVSALFISIFRFATRSYAILSNYHFSSFIIDAVFLFSLPIFFFALVIYEIYDVKIFEAYKKSTKYYFRKAGFVFLFLIYPLIVVITKYYVEEVFGLSFVGFILLLVNVFIAVPLIILVWYLYCLSCLDEMTNREYFKEYYHKGLSDNFIFNIKYNDEDTFLLK